MKVFTDGGCIGNGTSKARAAYGVYFVKGPYKQVCGLLRPNNYYLKDGELKFGVQTVSPTNIRAEMFAIITALLIIKKKCGKSNIEIVTDSEFTINVLTKWIGNWIANNLIFDKANPDLLLIIHELYNFHNVKLTHQRSHVKGDKSENVVGNNYVDNIVKNALKTFK